MEGRGPGPNLWPWLRDRTPASSFPPRLFEEDAERVARSLIGSILISTVDGVRVSGIVVETEAYPGPDDPASHARAEVGRTERNAAMFGPAGTAYVYRSYGIHWCMNVVTGSPGYPAAVLLRALEPREGKGTMKERRDRETDLCSGPGRLCQALGITGELDGHELTREPLALKPGWRIEEERIGRSGRIGVQRAVNAPLRYFLRDHPSVSRAPRR